MEADILDQATKRQEQLIEEALANHRNANRYSPPATGRCRNCGAEAPEGRAWCDAECEEEDRYVESRKRANR